MQGLGARHGVMPAPNPEQAERLQAVADTLRQLDCDSISLQEVPSKAALESLVKQGGLEELYPHRRFFKTNDVEGGNHLAELSKHPFTETRGNTDKNFKVEGFRGPGQFTRDVTETRVQIGGYTIRRYNTHMKANPQIRKDDPDYARKKDVTDAIRTGETRALKDILKANHKKYPNELFVVSMDANATPDDGNLRHLTGGFAPVHDPLGNQAGFATHPSSHRRLDYILLSDGLADKVVPGSIQVIDTPTTRKASDHAPMVLTVELPDLPPV